MLNYPPRDGGFNIVMATSPLTFVKQSYDELKKVKWSSRDEVVRLTIAVIAVSILVGIFLGIIDYALAEFIDFILKRQF